MTIFSFLELIKEIYGKKLPDLEIIEKKGLLAVKIAQHFALRIDFLDEKVCRHLSNLYRKNLNLSYEEVVELVEKYNGKGWLNIFESFEQEPFASASIGQVHYAKLSIEEEVVIKIIKKDYAEKFVKDVDKLIKFFKFITFFYPKLKRVFDPIGILNYIKEYTMEELDLRNEIRGRNILYDIAKKAGDKYRFDKLGFPVFYEGLSNEKVLVSKKIEGMTFDELLNQDRLEYSTILELFHIHGYYLFSKGIFHGDIHPGNIILGNTGEIYFVDTGAISKVEDKLRVGLFNFFKHLSDYNYEKCSYYLNKMAKEEIKGEKYEAFKLKFLDLYKEFTGSKVSEVSLTKKMMETIKLGVNSGMEFEKGMFAIIKSMMYMDGMVLRCNPKAILLKDMKPFIKELEGVVEEL